MVPADAASTGLIAVADAGGHRVLLLDPAGTVRAVAPAGVGPRALAARGGALYVANRGTERAPGSSLTVIDLARGIAERTLAVCEGCGPAALAFDEAGALLVTAQAEPALLTLPPPFARARVTRLDEPPGCVAALGAGRAALTITPPDLLLLEAQGSPRRLGVAVAPGLCAVRPGTSEVWSPVGSEPRLLVADLARPGSTAVRPAPAFVQDLAFLPEGRVVLVAGGRETMVVLFDAVSGRELGRVAFATAPRRIAVAPDGRRAAIHLPEEGRVAVLDVSDPARPRAAGGFELDVEAAAMLWVDAPSRR